MLCLDESGQVQAFPHELSHPDVRVIHQDRRGDMWFGTYGGGLNRLSKGQVTSFKTALGEYNNRAWWIHEDTDGVFWVGTRDGLNRFVPPGVVPRASSPPPAPTPNLNPNPNPNLNPPHPDPDGPLRFFTFTKRHGLYENTVNNIQEDDFGYLWLSGQQGIYRVARQDLNDVAAGRQARVQVLPFGEGDGMLNSECNGGVNQPSGCKDREGRIWFPTVRGVAMVDPRAVRRNEVPPPVVIEQVVADGEIVFGDGCAVGAGTKPRRSTLDALSESRPLTPALSHPMGEGAERRGLDVAATTLPAGAEGLPSPVGRERVSRDCGTGEGERSDFPGPSGKSEATLHSSLSTLHSSLPSLPAGRGRVVEIRYTANSFAAPKAMRFKYRLEGHDRDWRFDDDNARVAFYTNLRPGAYTFCVTGCNNHGVWSEQPALFALSIAPHFWQTWLFYLLTGAACIGLAAAIQAYRLHWQRRLLKVEHQHALADERARIARDLHDDLGTALTGLALQLDVLRRETREGAARADRLAEAAARIRALAERMRQVVWAVNPRCDTVSSLASFLEQQAGQFMKADGLRCRLEFPDDIPPLPLDGETRYELALGVREALANAIRHAHASELVLGLSVQADHLVVRVADNGRGFRVAEGMGQGRGLTNMQERLEKIGGQCDCQSAPGAGTTIALRVPLRAAPIPRSPLTP